MGFSSTYMQIIYCLLLCHQASYTNAFFILGHKTLLRTRLDPIVTPGAVTSHVHNIVGSSSFDRTYDYDRQRTGKCTTASVQEDKSSYWSPQLYWRNTTDNTYQAIDSYAKTYYLPRNSTPTALSAFPPGFRMLAGDMNRRTYNASDKTNQAVSFACLDYAGGHQGDPEWKERPDFFKHNCPDGLRAQVFFPSCWDGVNVDSPNHKDHVAYPTQQYNGGVCPASHPVQIISLFYEFIYSVGDYPFDTTPGAINWVFSTGDATGLGFHGDFTNGWPTGPNSLLQRVIDDPSCYKSQGSVDDCPVLSALQDNAIATACQPENPVVDEDVGFGHPIKRLPGDNPLWVGNVPKPSWGEPLVTPGFVNVTTTPKNGFQALGCIAEGASGRALKAFSTNLNNNSAAACTDICLSRGFAYAGIEYGKECYCDNWLSNGATNQTLPWQRCSIPCTANQAASTPNTYENCGGPSTLNLFYNPAGPISQSPSNAPMTLSNGWVSLNCVSEATSGRTLSAYSFASANMSNELCATTCAQKGYTLAGTQYASECYCDNSFKADGGKNATAISMCGMSCSSGNGFCGGSRLLTVYTGQSQIPAPVLPTGWSNYGCVAEPSGGRALIGFSSSDNTMTSTKCVALCASKGFAIAGTEYSRECYCANSFTKGSGALVSSSECSATCAGNNELCGGGGRLSVFSLSSSSISPTSAPTISSQAAAHSGSLTISSTPANPTVASSNSSSTSTVSSLTSLTNGWTPYACVVEATSGRTLSSYSFSSGNMTNDLCASTCARKGYVLAGTEYSRECYCGNFFSNGGGKNVSDTTCNMKCGGSSAMCGGPSRLSVFQGASQIPQPTLPFGWYHAGCSVEATNGRTLQGYSFTSSSMTSTICVSKCASLGFSIAGTQYANECYCGNNFQNGGGSSAPSSDCKVTCAGSDELCGGSRRLSTFMTQAPAKSN